MNSLITAIVVGVVAFAITLKVGFVIRDRRRAAEETAQHKQMTDQLMSIDLEGRVSLAAVLCAMANFGPIKLGSEETHTEAWFSRYTQLAQIAQRLNLGMPEYLYNIENGEYDQTLHILADSPEFMHFALRSLKEIDDLLDFFLFSSRYPVEVRRAVAEFLNSLSCTMRRKLHPIYIEFVGPIEIRNEVSE